MDRVDAFAVASMGLTLALEPTLITSMVLWDLKELRQMHQTLFAKRNLLERIELEIRGIVDAIISCIKSDPVKAQRLAVIASILGLEPICCHNPPIRPVAWQGQYHRRP